MELSDQAKSSLLKVVDRSAEVLSEAIDASGKLVRENAKDLVKEVIVYHGYINHGFSILGSLVMAAFILYGWSHAPADEGRMIVAGICLVLSFASIIWFLCSVQEILKARFAPRIFLVEYAADLCKSKPESK